jgi:hypothetical protein
MERSVLNQHGLHFMAQRLSQPLNTHLFKKLAIAVQS